MSGFTRFQAFRGSTSVWTRSLRHVDAVLPRSWSKRVSFDDPRIKDVKPKDRIKWWNIVPGDQVRVRGDPHGTLREVQLVNKLSNMVYLKRRTEVRVQCYLHRRPSFVYVVFEPRIAQMQTKRYVQKEFAIPSASSTLGNTNFRLSQGVQSQESYRQ